jgi:hypothetical protein
MNRIHIDLDNESAAKVLKISGQTNLSATDIVNRILHAVDEFKITQVVSIALPAAAVTTGSLDQIPPSRKKRHTGISTWDVKL